jgi:hypothetical protein
MLLRAGETCSRVARADRAALLVDMAIYFKAAKAAMSRATRSIHFLNWAFEQDTFFDPGPDCTGDEGDRFGNFLKGLTAANPALDIRILCWDSAMPVAATQRFFPFADRRAFIGTRLRIRLDAQLPSGRQPRLLRRRRHRAGPVGHPLSPRRRSSAGEDPARPQGLRQPPRGDGDRRRRRGGDAGAGVP